MIKSKNSRMVLMFLSICGLATAALKAQESSKSSDKTSNIKHQSNEQTDFQSRYPVVEYSKENLSCPNGNNKSKKYNKAVIPLYPDILSDTNMYSFEHWATDLSALPTEKSDAVVSGKVIEAKSYLSEDKTAVYSVFSIEVEKILKNDKKQLIEVGKIVEGERAYGAVKFSSSFVTTSHVNGQGLPQVGQKHIFFLTHDFYLQGYHEQDFHILTAYELKDARVFPIDNPGGGTHPLPKTYKNTEKSSFLNILQHKIDNDSKPVNLQN